MLFFKDKKQPYSVRTAALGVLAETSHPIALEAIQESVSNSSLFELDLLIDAISYLSKHGNEASTASLLDGLKSSENIIMDMPFPIPLSVTSSPSHIKKTVPVTKETTAIN